VPAARAVALCGTLPFGGQQQREGVARAFILKPQNWPRGTPSETSASATVPSAYLTPTSLERERGQGCVDGRVLAGAMQCMRHKGG
jgi:hypothetical protein